MRRIIEFAIKHCTGTHTTIIIAAGYKRKSWNRIFIKKEPACSHKRRIKLQHKIIKQAEVFIAVTFFTRNFNIIGITQVSELEHFGNKLILIFYRQSIKIFVIHSVVRAACYNITYHYVPFIVAAQKTGKIIFSKSNWTIRSCIRFKAAGINKIYFLSLITHKFIKSRRLINSDAGITVIYIVSGNSKTSVFKANNRTVPHSVFFRQKFSFL